MHETKLKQLQRMSILQAFPHVVNRSKLCRAIAEEGGQALRFPALGPLEEVGESPMWKAEPGAFPGGQNLLAAPGLGLYALSHSNFSWVAISFKPCYVSILLYQV